MTHEPTLSQKTNVSLGLVLTLIVAAFSYGVLSWKVEALRASQVTMQQQLTSLNDKIDRLTMSKLSQN